MSVQTQNTNLNPYSNTPIKNLEYIQNKALVIAPFEITKSGLLDTDLMLDTPGTITMYFFRKNFNDIDKEPTAEQFKTVGTVSDISAKLGLDITASNISSSITSSYYLGFTKISVIFKYDKNTGMRIIEKDNSLLGEDYIDIDIDNTCDLTTEDYFVICNVTKNTKATNTGFTESSSMDFLFMIPSSECQEIITDFDILDTNNKTINIKKNGTLGSGFVIDNDTTIEPAYEADFFGDGSNIATYLFDGNLNDENGTYNGTATGITYGEGKVGQAAVFDGTGTFRSKINLSGYTSYTMSAWVKKPTTTSTFSMGQGVNASGQRCEFVWYANGYLYAECGSDPNIFNNYLPPVNDTNWHHILYTFNNGITNMYFDGVLLSLVSSSGTLSTTVPIFTNEDFIIGLRYNISIVSHVDQVRIFNRALNQNEVTALYLNSISTRVIKQASNAVNDNWTQIQLETVESIQATNSNQPLTIKDPKRKDFFDDKSMVACYMLDSNANDETGMYNGTLSGSNFTFTSGKFGQCISVNNTNYVDLPETLSTIFGTNDFSISLWFKPSDTLVTHNILFATHSSNSPGFLTILLMDNKILTGVFDGSSRPSITHQDNILLTDWNHVVVTKESNIYKIYSNNVVSSTTLTSALSIACGDIRIGQNPAAPSLQYFNGQIDNVKIFNRALTDSEVTSLYDETISPIITLETETETIASEPDFFNDKSNIATYLFDNNVNDANDKYNGTATDITYGAGKFGNCANFDGTSSIKSKLDLSGLNSYTMSVWVKKNTIGSHFNMGQGVLTSAGVTSTGPRCELLWYHDGYLYAECGSNHSNWNKYLPPVIDTNWHHLLYTFNNGIINMYFDGGLLSLASSSGTISTTVPIFTSQDFVIGLRSTGNTLGQIDNVRIFNRALTQTEVQDLYRETKRVKYKAITLDANNFGPVSKFSIETQKEIKLLNYKTWTGTDATFQGYRIYPVMNISDHTTEETTFNPKFYLGSKYQRNLMEVLAPSLKTKRTIYNLKDIYLVDDMCIQTLKKINILLENNQMIKFTERLYNLTTPLTPLKEKLNAELILEYLSTPVSGTQNNDIAATLKTSLIEDYNFTQDEIDNLNDNLNTFKSRARININTPMVQGSGLDQLRFTLPKTFIDGNRSKTEKKNLLVFGTDAGFNKFGLSGYSAPYSNISKRIPTEILSLDDLTLGLSVLGSLEDVSTIKDFQMSYGDETQHILFENGNLYACRYISSNNGYKYNRDGSGFDNQPFPLKLINTNVKSMYCGIYATFIIDNNSDVWALGGYSSTSTLNYDIYGINNSGNYLLNWTKVFNNTPENTPKKVVGTYTTTWLLMESGELFCTGSIPKYYTFDGITKYTKTWISLASGVLDVDCGIYHVCYTLTNGEVYVGDSTNEKGLTTQSTNNSTTNTKVLKILTNWIPINQTIIQIECTTENNYYLLSNGDVYGVGMSIVGQLGVHATGSGYNTPRKLYTGVKRIIPQLFGMNNSGSVSMVELITGEIKCMGNTSDNKFGYFEGSGVTTPKTLYPKVDKIFLTERNVLAIIDGKIFNSGFNRFSGINITNQTITEQFLKIAISKNFGDLLTKYKQQIPFTYIPLSTDAANTNNEPVFENLTDITGFNNSDIIIDVPNVL